MKPLIAKLLKEAIEGLNENVELKMEEIEKLIEIPPSAEMGDFAFPCFLLASRIKENPNDIALELREEIGELDDANKFEDIQTNGPYINFFVDRVALALNLLKQIETEKDVFGKQLPTQEKIMVEFVSPNTNKPLHIGHLRNMALGESVSRILEFSGKNVIRACLFNDRGVHICKSLLAYQKWGKNSKPDKKTKPDHFVGKYYVLFGKKAEKKKELEEEAQLCLQEWELGNKPIIDTWKKMNTWAYAGFDQTLDKLKIHFDKKYYESETYTKGKEIVLEGIKKKTFQQRKDNAVIINLEKEGLGEKVLIRPDGTSVYITQDLYLAQLKEKEYNLNGSIYVVGNEQSYHFNVLFTILKKLGFKSASNLRHLSYGMVRLPEGKIKSREGTEGITADEVFDKVQKIATKGLEKKEKLPKKELEKRSLIIVNAAIKYFLLKVDSNKNMIFNPKESVNFEGDTGPYLQYSYARASSIIKKVNKNKIKDSELTELELKEIELVKKLSEFPEIVSKSYNLLNPSVIANYSYQLAQIFNEFYHECPVLKSEKEFFRLMLVESFRQVLKNSLFLLGIEVLEKM